MTTDARLFPEPRWAELSPYNIADNELAAATESELEAAIA